MFNAQGIVKPKRLEFEKNTISGVYGKFSAGPFERGYGVTTGNSLRRMLLSSIEGSAIVAVKFEGIFHGVEVHQDGELKRGDVIVKVGGVEIRDTPFSDFEKQSANE